MRFDAIKAMEKFKEFVPKGDGHTLRIGTPSPSDGVLAEFILTVSCECQGKFDSGIIFARTPILVTQSEEEVNDCLYTSFDSLNVQIDKFNKPQKEDCFV